MEVHTEKDLFVKMNPLQLLASEFKTDDQTFVDSIPMALFFLMV